MCLFGGGQPSAPVNPASTTPADAYTTVSMTKTPAKGSTPTQPTTPTAPATKSRGTGINAKRIAM